MTDDVSILLTVHNKQDIVGVVLDGIFNNISRSVKEVIVILDGCTDKTKEIVNYFPYDTSKIYYGVYETPDLNETLANNYGLRFCASKYTIIVQDDCVIQEPDFDKRMIKPFNVVPNLLAVSGRDAVDTRILNGKLDYYNCGGVDANTPRNIFSIRDAVNRSPLMLHNARAEKLGYFDPDFAPLDSDDVDLSIRGYKEYGYRVGSYVINYYSPLSWGTTRNNPNSARIWEASMIKNHKLIVDRHYDFIVGEKHSEDIIIP